MDHQYKELRIYTDSGRVLRPLLIVEETERDRVDVDLAVPKLKIKKRHIEKLKSLEEEGQWTFSNLVEEGLVEYVDVEEEETVMIAMRMKARSAYPKTGEELMRTQQDEGGQGDVSVRQRELTPSILPLHSPPRWIGHHFTNSLSLYDACFVWRTWTGFSKPPCSCPVHSLRDPSILNSWRLWIDHPIPRPQPIS